MDSAPTLVSLSPLEGVLTPSTAAEACSKAYGHNVPQSPNTNFFRRHFAASHSQGSALMPTTAMSSGHVKASHQAFSSQRPFTAPEHAASDAVSSSLSPAERTAMQQVVASRLKSMARSFQRPTPSAPYEGQRPGSTAGDDSSSCQRGWSDVLQPAQQPQSAHLVGWARAAAPPPQPEGRQVAQMQRQLRPNTTASAQHTSVHPGRGGDPDVLARPSTSAGVTGRTGAGGWAYGRSHARLARSYDSALGAPLSRQSAPLCSAKAIASAKPPPQPGASATATAYARTANCGLPAGRASRQPLASQLFGNARKTPRIATSMLIDGSTRAAALRPSRGTVLSVFEDLDAHGEGRVTFSTFEQAGVAVGMKHGQVQRLFSRLDSAGKGYITVRDWGRPDVEGPLNYFTQLYVSRTRGADGRHKDAHEVQSLYAALQMALFKLQLKNSGRSISHERLVQAFEFIDRDGSGALDKREVLDAFHGMGIYIRLEVLEEAMRTFDKNGDGLIQYQEFVSTLFPNLAKGFRQ